MLIDFQRRIQKVFSYFGSDIGITMLGGCALLRETKQFLPAAQNDWDTNIDQTVL